VRTFEHGEANTLMSRTDPEVSRDERYNGVLAFNPDDDSVRSLATLADGPLAWGGPYGRKVLFYSSPLLTSATVAAAAQTRLRGLQGRTRKITAEIAPDPSIEPGDHVRITWPTSYGSRTSTSELALVRRVEHPIGIGTSSLELRGVG
jgi:hypothetical protein